MGAPLPGLSTSISMATLDGSGIASSSSAIPSRWKAAAPWIRRAGFLKGVSGGYAAGKSGRYAEYPLPAFTTIAKYFICIPLYPVLPAPVYCTKS